MELYCILLYRTQSIFIPPSTHFLSQIKKKMITVCVNQFKFSVLDDVRSIDIAAQIYKSDFSIHKLNEASAICERVGCKRSADKNASLAAGLYYYRVRVCH